MAHATKTRSRGMTLVELLVVLAIVGLLTSLVAPVGGDVMRRAKSQEEWMQLERAVEGLAFSAFAEGREIDILAEGKRLSWAVAGQPRGTLQFEHIFFEPKQSVQITSNGVASKGELSARHRNVPRSIALNHWVLN